MICDTNVSLGAREKSRERRQNSNTFGYEGTTGQTLGFCKILLQTDFFMHQVFLRIQAHTTDMVKRHARSELMLRINESIGITQKLFLCPIFCDSYPLGFGQGGQLFWLCHLPSPCDPQPLTVSTAQEAEMSLNLCSATIKYCCVANITLILNPEHSTVSATRKIINPVETRTINLRKLLYHFV